jgi:hypothetical protein
LKRFHCKLNLNQTEFDIPLTFRRRRLGNPGSTRGVIDNGIKGIHFASFAYFANSRACKSGWARRK